MAEKRVQKWEVERAVWVYLRNARATHVAHQITLMDEGTYLCRAMCGASTDGSVMTHSTGYYVRNTLKRGLCRKCVAMLKKHISRRKAR